MRWAMTISAISVLAKITDLGWLSALLTWLIEQGKKKPVF